MKASLSERKEKERKFLEQLLDGSKVEQYKVPIPIKADLRKYQQVRCSGLFRQRVSSEGWFWNLNDIP